MRPELEQIAQIDAYVNKTMNVAETAAFEAEMQSNLAIQQAVETQQLLVTAVNRKALLAIVTAATPPLTIPPREGSMLSKFKWPIILSSIVVGAVISWFAFKSDEEKIATNQDDLQASQVMGSSQNKQPLFSDSLSENNIDFTYQPTLTTTTINSRQRQFGGLETWVSPEVQSVVIDPSKKELVECNDGTLILVPENAFIDADGNTVSQPVTLEIIEALTMDKIVAYNLATMSNGEALKSDGMVYVQPSLNGTELTLAEGKSMHIEIPTDNYDPNMKAWEGTADGDGNLNWENPQEIENYLIPVSMNSLEFLPNGFREEVDATLPFRGYKSSSKQLEDSLYYSFENPNQGSLTSNKNEMPTPIVLEEKPVQQDKRQRMSREMRKATRSNTQLNPVIEEGIAVIRFTNLSDGRYTARISPVSSKISWLDTLKNNEMVTDYLGEVNITIYHDECDNFTFNGKILSSAALIELNCESWDCLKASTGDFTTSATSPTPKCYLNPSSVFAIQKPEFENTFIATREFQERLQALHKIKNAQPLLELYVTQLDKNLHEIDSQVANKLTGEDKITFEKFAVQKLTNVKPDGQEFDRLKEFYSAAVKKQQQEISSQQKAYDQKSIGELLAVQKDLADVRSEFNTGQARIRRRYGTNQSPIVEARNQSTNNFIRSEPAPPRNIVRNPKPKIGKQASYKVNWYGTGWMNIDSYLHLLAKGKKGVPIAVAGSNDLKVYQSVNSLNTLLTLNNPKNEYTAFFPKKRSPVFEKSLALGVSRADGKLKLAAQFFNPYDVKAVALNNWEEVTEDEFKRRLKELYPGGERMLSGMRQQEMRLKQAIERQRRAEEQRQLMAAELDDLQKTFESNTAALTAKEQSIKKRQATERAYIQHLIDFVDPCTDCISTPENSINKATTQSAQVMPIAPRINSSEIIPTKWDVEPKYPGGNATMNSYLAQNIQYPQEALDQGISGRVYLNVTLDNRGKIQEVSILRSEPKSALLEDEAVRVVMAMPNWEPAQRGEIFVPSKATFPVDFTLR